MRIWKLEGEHARMRHDTLAGEEPLELRISADGERRSVGVTMRTPGADFELAAGMLYTSGLVDSRATIRQIAYCADADEEQRYNIVTIELNGSLPEPHEQRYSAGSACGVCGAAAIADVGLKRAPALPTGAPLITPELLYGLPDRLREAQGLFTTTGGLHAAALFNEDGALLALREDIGRHNAVDKVLGWALLAGRSVNRCIMLVSGRAGFEIVEKALASSVPILCSVSAPSSLAVALAREHGMTLIGFLRGERCNVYAGIERVRRADPTENERAHP